ncbi:MAG: ribosome assembly cofactor RimP [Ginsengibacter sp.]
MINAAPQIAIESCLNSLLQNSEDVFVVEVKINSGNNIIVFLDADNGISIEKCVQINRALYKYIEENSLFENGNFSLEVSSPGVDEPLKLTRQYKKNIGRTVEVVLTDESKKQGKLFSVNDDEIIIGETTGKVKGKKLPGGDPDKEITILFNQIKHTKVLVTF